MGIRIQYSSGQEKVVGSDQGGLVALGVRIAENVRKEVLVAH